MVVYDTPSKQSSLKCTWYKSYKHISYKMEPNDIPKGYVYAFINQCMEGIVKIGFTMRDPTERLKEANSSGTFKPPTDYTILTSRYIENPYKQEQSIHHRLKDKRIKDNREFFKITHQEVLDIFNGMPYDIDTKPDNVQCNEIRKTEDKIQRQSKPKIQRQSKPKIQRQNTLFVPSMKRFTFDSNTNHYVKRFIFEDNPYDIHIPNEKWNTANRRRVERFLKKDNILSIPSPCNSFITVVENECTDNNQCEFCKKTFSRFDNKVRHQQTCKLQNTINKQDRNNAKKYSDNLTTEVLEKIIKPNMSIIQKILSVEQQNQICE